MSDTLKLALVQGFANAGYSISASGLADIALKAVLANTQSARITHRNAGDYSKMAANLNFTGTRRKVYDAVLAAGDTGLTAPEVAEVAGVRRLTAGASLTVLQRSGLIRESGFARPNIETGRPCMAYTA